MELFWWEIRRERRNPNVISRLIVFLWRHKMNRQWMEFFTGLNKKSPLNFLSPLANRIELLEKKVLFQDGSILRFNQRNISGQGSILAHSDLRKRFRFETVKKSVFGWQQSIEYGLEGLDGPLYSGEMEFLNRPLSDIYANQSVEIDAKDFIRRHKLSGWFSRFWLAHCLIQSDLNENCSKLIKYGKYQRTDHKHCLNVFNWDWNCPDPMGQFVEPQVQMESIN